MENIREGKLKMKPKYYFILGSVLTFVGLVFSIFASVLLVGLMRFALRVRGPMAEMKFNMMLNAFPWWAPVFAILGLVLGIWLIRKYDFSYKINFKLIVIGGILVVLAAGWMIDVVGFNDALIRRGPAKGMMQRHFLPSSIEYRPNPFVDPIGFEPMTSSLQMRRSTN